MSYQHYFKCSVCGCKETSLGQFGDDGAKFCLDCGMPLESFVQDENEPIPYDRYESPAVDINGNLH